MMIYGVSALLIREATLRWKTGPAGVIVLGLAFGILNEGMTAHSLFNPNWPDLGRLTGFGYYGGVNWIWTEWIVPFHAVWSMSFPILLVRKFWPDLRNRTLVSTRWLYALLPVPVLGAVITTAWFIGYPPNALQWAGMAATMAVLIGVSYRYLPRLPGWRPLGPYRASPRTAALVGALFFVVGQIGIFSTATLGVGAPVVFLVVLLMYLGFVVFASSLDDTPRGERARFAFAIGGTSFYVALSPVSEFLLGRVGLIPIDVGFLVFLVWLYRKRAGEEGARVEAPPEAVVPGFGLT